jgi:hypothetical protein
VGTNECGASRHFIDALQANRSKIVCPLLLTTRELVTRPSLSMVKDTTTEPPKPAKNMPIGNSGVGFSIHSALMEANGNINKTAMTVPHRAEPDTAFCERCVLIF